LQHAVDPLRRGSEALDFGDRLLGALAGLLDRTGGLP